jgi:hypothetical protein
MICIERNKPTRFGGTETVLFGANSRIVQLPYLGISPAPAKYTPDYWNWGERAGWWVSTGGVFAHYGMASGRYGRQPGGS